MIEQPRLAICRLRQPFPAASPYAETDRARQPEQIVMRNLCGAARSFEFLVTDAIGQQNRLRIFNLDQKIANSRQSLIERDDFNPAEQARRVQLPLAFE